MTREEYKAMSRAERAVEQAKLPARQQKCWELHARGYSFNQIALALELPDASTAWRYFKTYHKQLNQATQNEMKDSLIAELRSIQSTTTNDKIRMQAIDRIMKLYNLGNTAELNIKQETFVKYIEGIPPEAL